MSDFVKQLIYLQNLEFLKRISDDQFKIEEEKANFIQKYHKKNFSYLHEVKRDTSERDQKRFDKLMR
uniref:Uncharacterized protein n=1 Tax=viral metagenome TaxID=1070528 RepID=A0A6C0L3I2_9ZZZZ|tara:strand:- start:2918 stop:3118 length:201 start_codon:yes stop_codon:yes gene_type:complete